ncbi:MAG: hypothetical protein ACOX05_05735 [Bacillota bacterium]|jgi:hypothetical protein
MDEKIKLAEEEDFVIDLSGQSESSLVLDSDIVTEYIMTSDYNELENLPSINAVALKGNRNLAEDSLTNMEIEEIINNQF